MCDPEGCATILGGCKAGGGGGGPLPPYGVVWVTRCCGSQADTQSQQNKILISGTRGAFRSGNRSSVMMPAPRYWAAAIFCALQRNTVSMDTVPLTLWMATGIGSRNR